MLIHGHKELAKALDIRTKDYRSFRAEVQKQIRDYTDGKVWIIVGSNYVEFRSNVKKTERERLEYPFDEDTFWKTADFIQMDGEDLFDIDWIDEEA